ncbi:MAG TPA: carboxypeptidase regulatory-like domain-containing protein [Polyangiaceae bacterium]|nr:carboxypeptidase regulatory-like domain-containing protein [Polyangiaceae bacterium]
MSTDKGESDLDVFNDLKPQTPDGIPITDSKKTLMGIPVPDGSLGNSTPTATPRAPAASAALSSAPPLPPVPGSSPNATRSVPPPPPSQRPRRSGPPPLVPGLPPPSSRPGLGNLALQSNAARRLDEAERNEVTPAGTVDIPPLASRDNAAKDRGGLGLDSWATTAPASAVARASSALGSAPPRPIDTRTHDSVSSVLSSAALTSAAALSSAAVASAAAPAAAGPATAEPGWDDDDDKTTIYDKDTQAAAQSLLQPVIGTDLLGRPPPPMSRPPGNILPPGGLTPAAAFGGRITAPPSPQDATFSFPPQPAPSQRLPYALAFAAALIVALLAWFMLPKKGALTVTVAGGPGNKELSAVEVVLDNKLRCKTSPCEIPSLKAGTHYVEVRAAGYQATAKSAVAIVSGQTAVHNVQLIRAGTGIKVFGEGTGLTLLVDGKEFGPLPQELREMEPGEHVIQVTGGPRYEVFQQRIVVDPDRMTPIGPIRLKVVKGLATIRAGESAEDAEVTLKVGDSRRVLPPLPVRLEVETDRPHVLIARKKGFATFEQPIVFDDGQAEKTIEITLSQRGADPKPRRVLPGSAALNEGDGADTAEPESAAAATGSAKLTLTSTPPSNVLLDGKPLGTTPLREIAVEPGEHRVIFIHGAERKPRTIKAEAGSSTTISENF